MVLECAEMCLHILKESQKIKTTRSCLLYQVFSTLSLEELRLIQESLDNLGATPMDIHEIFS